jgi:hypothetical protein
MNNEIKEMLKNAIQENAVSFKETTSKVLYSKIGNKLQEQYKSVAKNWLGIKNETNNRTN